MTLGVRIVVSTLHRLYRRRISLGLRKIVSISRSESLAPTALQWQREIIHFMMRMEARRRAILWDASRSSLSHWRKSY